MYKQIPIIDAHQDILIPAPRQSELDTPQTSWDLLSNSSVRLVFSAVSHLEAEARANPDFIRGELGKYLQVTIDYPGFYQVLFQDHLDAPSDGRIGIVAHIEGADALTDRHTAELLLGQWFDAGVRSVGIVWNGGNQLGGGAGVNRGLTRLGRHVITWLDQHNFVVDLAHTNENSFWGAFDLIREPAIVSHGNCRAVCDHPRNLSDAQLCELADRGGVLGISLVPSFVAASPEGTDPADGGVTVGHLIRHFDHAIQIMGIDHVGIGTDFGGIMARPLIPELEDVTKTHRILRALQTGLGLSDEDLAKIAFGNFERILCSRLPA